LNGERNPHGGIHLQQAIEKWLKAFLLHHGWTLRRTHELEALLDEAIRYEQGWSVFGGLCQRARDF
jgi:HEPN domain-containing protein